MLAMIAETAEIVEQFTAEEVIQLLELVQPILSQEPRLIKLPDELLVFVGDTHGDWEATKRILVRFWETHAIFVFLGDYVDRGSSQIENMNLLFALKTKVPQRIILLRGNHETPRVNRSYGFYDTVQDKLGDIIDHYWKTFALLPLAAISQQQRIFAVHGGIPEGLINVKEIDSLPREVEPEDTVSYQLLWNDPRETLKGFGPSMRGSRIRTFGKDITIDFLGQNSLKLIVRAHEVFHQGFHEYFEGQILSLFSCKEHCGTMAGKVLRVSKSGKRDLIPV